MTRKVYIKSYGCQMNVYDSHRMADLLAPEGYVETAAPEDADLVLLNTCHIREKAAEKVYSEIGRLRQLKEDAAKQRAARDRGGGGLRRAGGRRGDHPPRAGGRPGVGPQSYHRLPDLLARKQRAVETEFPVEDKFDFLPAPSKAATRARGVTAFVTVQEGCDKFCTFCVVPYTRGAEVSRPVEKIVEEVRRPRRSRRARGDAARPERQRVSRRGSDGRTWSLGAPAASHRRNPRHRAAALHHQPPARRRR